MRRVFIGIKSSQSFQAEAEKWRRDFAALPVRWTLPEHLHLTLVPPWQETDAAVAASRMREAVRGLAAFDLLFTRVQYGPVLKEPRFIWAKAERSEALSECRRRLDAAFGKTESREHRPHVTLARFRPEDFRAFQTKELDEAVSWREHVDALTLFSSRADGAGYYVLAREPLKNVEE